MLDSSMEYRVCVNLIDYKIVCAAFSYLAMKSKCWLARRIKITSPDMKDMPTYPLWPFSRFYLFIYLTRWHHNIVMVTAPLSAMKYKLYVNFWFRDLYSHFVYSPPPPPLLLVSWCLGYELFPLGIILS